MRLPDTAQILKSSDAWLRDQLAADADVEGQPLRQQINHWRALLSRPDLNWPMPFKRSQPTAHKAKHYRTGDGQYGLRVFDFSASWLDADKEFWRTKRISIIIKWLEECGYQNPLVRQPGRLAAFDMLAIKTHVNWSRFRDYYRHYQEWRKHYVHDESQVNVTGGQLRMAWDPPHEVRTSFRPIEADNANDLIYSRADRLKVDWRSLHGDYRVHAERQPHTERRRSNVVPVASGLIDKLSFTDPDRRRRDQGGKRDDAEQPLGVKFKTMAFIQP